MVAMGELQHPSSTSSALDARHERPISLRRARPPDIDVGQNENRIPLRAERASKRESKIGLRSIFARTKAGKTDKDVEEPPRSASRSGIRASLVDFGTWPYRLHSSRSEVSLLSPGSVGSRLTPTDLASPHRLVPGSPNSIKPKLIVPRSDSAVAASWNPPPLFQVYPQAVKHGTLPACNVSVEALARQGESRSNRIIQGARMLSPDYAGDSNAKTMGDMLKKRQRIAGLKNSWEWTSKIFVLVTSGYLLQYAAEGSFNRVPEKILQLTATSAAYASDLIPGRHWVIQVASSTDAEGHTFMDSKSRRPKLSIRDNRRVSNMLLVFENAEDMDSWLAVLRKEIEFHGGKKKVSETGKSEAEESPSETESQPTQRAIVVKDRDRFSYVITRDFSYPRENGRVDPETDGPVAFPHRQFPTHMVYNSSPTASMVSADGQRLDNLRDSSSSHRFSYVSSGQRTVVTSAGSSPACSPTRASFSSQGEDVQSFPNVPEVRLRPNAAAIVNRRQSMQALISSLDAPMEQDCHSYASSTSAVSHENEHPSAPSVPNFSVPHAVSKRFSLNTSMPSGLSHPPQTVDYDKTSKTSRKPPPTALSMSRPLSIVFDQPSPRSPCSPISLSRSIDSCRSTPLEANYATGIPNGSPEQSSVKHLPGPSNRSPPSQPGSTNRPVGERHDYFTSRSGVDAATPADDARTYKPIRRAASALDSYGARPRLSGMTPNNDRLYKRSSLISESHSSPKTPYQATNADEWKSTPDDKTSPAAKTSCSPKRSAPSLRGSLAVDTQDKLVTSRRSMPQLNDGLPPAPPPSCALPPIPQKHLQPTS
ncbi:hypothetical protein F4802DRAFT_310173 [Xylaria palmicola]|nr:hypothetical protein F4802DRAFT_310173 [Xylaria palmicola]